MLGHGTCLRAPMLLLLLLLKRRSSQGCLLSIPCEERRKTFGRVERREHVIHPSIIPPSQRFDDNTCHTFLYSSSDLFRHHTTRAYICMAEYVQMSLHREVALQNHHFCVPLAVNVGFFCQCVLERRMLSPSGTMPCRSEEMPCSHLLFVSQCVSMYSALLVDARNHPHRYDDVKWSPNHLIFCVDVATAFPRLNKEEGG